MKINTIKQTLLQHLFALLGLCIVLYYIWFRVLRDRAPQIIPFETSWISFLIVLIICLTYLYIILRIYRPKSAHPSILKLLQLIKRLYYPLIVLDEKFRTNSMVKTLIIKLLFYFNIFIKKYKLYLYDNQNVFQLVFFHLPKFILLFVFCLDVFYFRQIKLFYYFLGLAILSMVFNYLLYLIKLQFEEYLEYLDKSFLILILSTNEEKLTSKDDEMSYMFFPSELQHINEFFDRYVVHTKYFIDIQATSITFNYDLLKYDCIETIQAREIYAEKHHIQLPEISVFEPRYDDIAKALAKEFDKLMPIAINVSAFFKEYIFVKQKSDKIKRLNIMIILMYLICWVYIFWVSFINLDILVSCISNIIDNIEPFSQSNLEDGTEIHNQLIQDNARKKKKHPLTDEEIRQQELKRPKQSAELLKNKNDMALRQALPQGIRKVLEFKDHLERQKAAFEEKKTNKREKLKNDHEPNKKYT